MKILNINGKKYCTKKLDYNAACELEKLGFPMLDCINGKNIENQTFNIFRAYCAWIMDVGIPEATKEASSHLKAGYSIDDIVDDISEQLLKFKATYFCQNGFRKIVK